jgi:hypothetical protein
MGKFMKNMNLFYKITIITITTLSFGYLNCINPTDDETCHPLRQVDSGDNPLLLYYIEDTSNPGTFDPVYTFDVEVDFAQNSIKGRENIWGNFFADRMLAQIQNIPEEECKYCKEVKIFLMDSASLDPGEYDSNRFGGQCADPLILKPGQKLHREWYGKVISKGSGSPLEHQTIIVKELDVITLKEVIENAVSELPIKDLEIADRMKVLDSFLQMAGLFVRIDLNKNSQEIIYDESQDPTANPRIEFEGHRVQALTIVEDYIGHDPQNPNSDSYYTEDILYEGFGDLISGFDNLPSDANTRKVLVAMPSVMAGCGDDPLYCVWCDTPALRFIGLADPDVDYLDYTTNDDNYNYEIDPGETLSPLPFGPTPIRDIFAQPPNHQLAIYPDIYDRIILY